MLSIEWGSDFHKDGTKRRRLRASTVHGWITKWRGTFLGDERLRSSGMREMREAAAVRKYNREARRNQPKKREVKKFSPKKTDRAARSAPSRRTTAQRQMSGSRPVPSRKNTVSGTSTKSASRQSTRTRSPPSRRTTKDSKH